MTTKNIKLIVFIALLVHGIGHMQGVVSSLGVKFNKSTTNVSWMLKGLGEGTNRAICLVLYFGAAIAGIIAALSFFNILISNSNWQMFAVVSAVFSIIALFLFPKALAMFFNKAGAVIVNAAIFYTIVFQGQLASVIFED